MDDLFFDCHFWREIRVRRKKEGNIKGRGCNHAKVAEGGGSTRVAVHNTYDPPSGLSDREAIVHLRKLAQLSPNPNASHDIT